MRVVLNGHNDLDVFLKLCAAAEQPCVKAPIDASARCFFLAEIHAQRIQMAGHPRQTGLACSFPNRSNTP